MFKFIVVTLLLYTTPQASLAANQCYDLFRQNLYIVKIAPKKTRSFIYDSRFFIDQLTKNGQLDKIKNSDPNVDHIPFLQKVLIESQIEVRRMIIEKNIFMPNLSILENALADRVSARSVTLNFYNRYLKFLTIFFTKESQPILPAWINEQLRNKSDTSFDRSIFSDDSQLKVAALAELDFYDFFELWPDIYPEGISLDPDLEYHGTPGTPEKFRMHDDIHNGDFYRAYSNLSKVQKEKFKRIIAFLRHYRTNLTEQDQIILGIVLFSTVHESNKLAQFISAFEVNDYNFSSDIFHAYYILTVESKKSYTLNNLTESKLSELFGEVWDEAFKNFQESLIRESL